MSLPAEGSAAGRALGEGSGGNVEIQGEVARITFHNPDTGFTVARVEVDGREVTVVGPMPTLAAGAHVHAKGTWSLHPRFGRQLTVTSCHEATPVTLTGMQRYLSSGLITGIGPVLASRIVNHFGLDTLRVLDEDPGRIKEVPGVGRTKARQVATAWENQQRVKALMLFLQSHGVGVAVARRLDATYGDSALAVIQRDPYRAARDVEGIGFQTADTMAMSLGMPMDSPRRLEAGVTHTLARRADEGHTEARSDSLAREAAELLSAPVDAVQAAIHRLAANERLQWDPVEPDRVALPWLARAEAEVAVRLVALTTTGESRMPEWSPEDLKAALSRAEAGSPHALAPEQRQAVELALLSRVAVVTGGPGTGKTTSIRTLLGVCRAAGSEVALAAPTGRAAKRLAEATGLKASTLHRLLEFVPKDGSFLRSEAHPLNTDMVIVDEASMVDILLMNSLMRALPPGCHLLIVGDGDQLPSVGPGNVLRDVIDSGVVPVVRLERIFRQSETSHIVENAHRIRVGEEPIFPKDSSDSFHFRCGADSAEEVVVDVVAHRIPRRFGLDPKNSIQVLSPMRRGTGGVANLNERLQMALNPARPGARELVLGGRVLRVGDRVMQVKNNYDLDVFNGDIGVVTGVSPTGEGLTVEMDTGSVVYDRAGADDLVLAYATTVHKSQGSEFPAVVLVLLPGHHLLLQRHLVYTAVSRARNLLVVVGDQWAIRKAVATDAVSSRDTSLARRLTRLAPAGGQSSQQSITRGET